MTNGSGHLYKMENWSFDYLMYFLQTNGISIAWGYLTYRGRYIKAIAEPRMVPNISAHCRCQNIH